MKEEELLLGRLKDLAKQSYNRNIYSYSDFLGLFEQSVFESHRGDFAYTDYRLYGGYEMAERKLICFGSEEEFGYEAKYPIAVVAVALMNEKFGEKLTHRDYLGALMNLGIKRETLGDIRISGNKAYLFCLDKIRDFICKELTFVKHTRVTAKAVDFNIPELQPKIKEESYPVASLRLDVIIAAACKKSRKEVLELFEKCEVTLNGHITTSNSEQLKVGDVFSVRRQGKFIFESIGGNSKRGRTYINLGRYE
ncbi:MAG: hypothetical protein K5931_00360 [Lachnospiraceae bacterium]|nr:hypothetical protein [Lachnospiraceae bacterium]